MKKYWIPLFLAVGFFVMCFMSISDYGLSCDAPIHMLRGQAITQFFLTGKTTYDQPPRLSPMIFKPGDVASRYYFSAEETINGHPVQLPQAPLFRQDFENAQQGTGQRFSFYTSNYWNGNFFFNLKPSDAGHPPLVDILSAFSNRIFYGALGILGDIESYQLVYILISSVGIFIVSFFAYQIAESMELSPRSRLVVSFIAGISLALLPYFISSSHVEMKDPEQAVFFTGAIWAFWNWIRTRKLKWFIITNIFLASAFTTKWNIVFLPFIFIPWLFLIRKTGPFKKWFNGKKLIILAACSGIFLILVFTIIWPYTWSDPIGKLIATVQYYSNIGVAVVALQPSGFIFFGFNTMPAILLLNQNPEITLILLFIFWLGVYKKKFKDEFKTEYLLLLWFLVPFLRVSVPPFKAYGGLRQIVEIFPVISVSAGLGAGYFLDCFKFKIRNLEIYFCGFVFFILAVPIIQLHPFEGSYSNILHPISTQIFGRDVVSWVLSDSSAFYKQNVEWLNKNAPKNAKLVFLNGCSLAISPLWLRPDISFSPYNFSGFDQKGEYIITDFDPSVDPPVFISRYLYRFLNPVHVIHIAGQVNEYVFKNDPTYVKPAYLHQKKIADYTTTVMNAGSDYLQVDLGRQERVTKIIADDASPACLSSNYALIDFTREKYIDGLSPYVLNNTFGFNERQLLPNRQVAFLFPATFAQIIRIFPQSSLSCFAAGKIAEIDVLSN